MVQPLQAILDVRVVRALKAAIIAVAGGADLTLTSIGRRLPGGTVKHHIKRVDRLLGNASLQERLSACWASVSQEILPPSGPIHILIDWTGGPNGSESWILSASIPHEGRAIRIYEAVCPENELDLSTRARSLFLDVLASFIPQNRQVIVIADAFFSCPFSSPSKGQRVGLHCQASRAHPRQNTREL